MTAQQIAQRLLFIIEDANRLLNHIESGKAMAEPTAFADNGWTHLSNIQIAADLKDTESDTWKGVDSHGYSTATIEANTRKFLNK